MTYLRTAGFGGLFGVTFTVAATFQLTLGALGVVTAILSPGFFKMGVVPASNPAQALGVLLMLTAMLLAMNAMISAAGAGLWVLFRRWLPAEKTKGS
jgi:hypothetical protein